MANKPKLDKLFTQLIKNAMSGKPEDKNLTKEFYNIFVSDMDSQLKDLPKSDQKKIQKEIGKIDTKLSKQLQKELAKDNVNLNQVEKKIEKSLQKEDFDLQKEIENFQKHSDKKTQEKGNGVSINELLTSTIKLSEQRKKNIEVKDIDFITADYDTVKNTLLYELKVESLSSGKEYQVCYYFYELSDIGDDKDRVKIKDKDTKKVYMVEIPLKNKTSVSVSCTCEDYRYTFIYANDKHRCHYGEVPTNFKQKAEKRNEGSLIGFCRHLISGISFLEREGLID